MLHAPVTDYRLRNSRCFVRQMDLATAPRSTLALVNIRRYRSTGSIGDNR